MALFAVSRYAGEEEDADDEAQEERARVLLERLREQAKARQLRRQQELGGAGPGPEDEAAEGKKSAESAAEGRGGLRKEREGGSAVLKRRRDGEPGPGADSEGDTEQREDRSNLKKKSSKKKKRDEGTEGAEARKKENSERAEGNQSTEEELPSADLGEEAHPPASSLAVLGDYDKKPVQKVQPFLPHWLAQPKLVQKRIKENLIPIRDVPGIHPRLLKKLQMNGIESFFPVQAEVIPAVLQSASNGYLLGQGGYRPKDICVSAPTGSGKTLSFVIPIVQVLLDRVVCQVRALVVLPTKELAQQVSKVFNIYTDGTGLKVVLITGQKSFAKEQEMLVQKKVTGYCSLADIIVATPGRLADHISKTPGFSLTQLRFLIIDEADRMIDDMHQNWLNQVVKAAFQAENEAGSSTLFQRTKPGPVTAASCCYPQIPLQKLLFSATLTQDPEKLQQLGLFQPRLFTSVYSEKKTLTDGTETDQDSEEKYTLPEGLLQSYVPCDLNSKPLLLLHFMLTKKFTRVLCFTNSREASHRLFLLVQAFGGITVAEFSSRLPPNERQRTMKEFEQGKIQL
uniref:ATP-dependent RNA helicase n=1 Tax=Pavo cristatus TaxID=9049 RepID=A0A8C9EMT6_PAVCR